MWFTCVLSLTLAIIGFCFALLWLVCPLGLLRIESLADVVYLLRAGFGFGNYLLLLCFSWCVHFVCNFLLRIWLYAVLYTLASLLLTWFTAWFVDLDCLKVVWLVIP
jgi:hypothetical protein